MPILKKRDKSQTNNNIPISLVSCVGKAFERVIFKHVYNHLITNSLIYQYQSGFLPGHSTVHHLIEFVHNTCLALEKYEMNCQIFCDISKAFSGFSGTWLMHTVIIFCRILQVKSLIIARSLVMRKSGENQLYALATYRKNLVIGLCIVS